MRPSEATTEDLLVVHTARYLSSLRGSLQVARVLEVPPLALLPNFLVQRRVLKPLRHQTGGTILVSHQVSRRRDSLFLSVLVQGRKVSLGTRMGHQCRWGISSLFSRPGRWILCLCRFNIANQEALRSLFGSREEGAHRRSRCPSSTARCTPKDPYFPALLLGQWTRTRLHGR